MAHGGSSRYYEPSNKEVFDGDTAEAADLNAINNAVDVAFEEVADDLDNLEVQIHGSSALAKKWATDPVGTNPDPIFPDEYSSYANKKEAREWASAPGTVIDAAGVDTGEKSAKTLAQEVVTHTSEAADSAAEALISEEAAAISEANALVSEGNAHDSEVAAGTSETNAGVSEVNSLASELKSHKWAEEAEDVEVDPGEYSSHHWALKANQIVGYVVNYSQPNGSIITTKGTTAQRDVTPLSGYLRFNTDEESFEGFDGNEWAGIGGGGLAWETSDAGIVTAEDGKGYLLDCSAAARTVNLPVGVVGEQIGVGDWKGDAGTNTITVHPNGAELIMGLAEDLTLDIDNSCVVLTYANSTEGWKIIQTTPSGNVLPNILHGTGVPSDSLGADGDIYMKIA